MVFNFHPVNSYSDYRVGCYKPGPYKVRFWLYFLPYFCPLCFSMLLGGAASSRALQSGAPSHSSPVLVVVVAHPDSTQSSALVETSLPRWGAGAAASGAALS